MQTLQTYEKSSDPWALDGITGPDILSLVIARLLPGNSIVVTRKLGDAVECKDDKNLL